MAKHTPGPWGLSMYENWPDCAVDEKGMQICFFYPVEQVPYSGMESDIHRANARLIAAAPEMYEALRDILNRCKAGSNDFDGAIRSLNPSQDGGALIAARAIIAKIEGK